MANIEQALTQAFRRWFTTAAHYTVGVIKVNHLQGPRPQKLGVVTGNLRNRIASRITADGFIVGTNVDYGIFWEKGIKAHTITAKRAKMLAIPVKLAKGTTAKKAGKAGILKTGKGRGVIFRKSVFIPAQAPRKWLEPGIQESLPGVMAMGEAEMRSVLYNFKDKTV